MKDEINISKPRLMVARWLLRATAWVLGCGLEIKATEADKKPWNRFQFGAALIKALGLPANTTWVELRMAVDEPITVRCGYFLGKVSAEHGELVCAELRKVEMREEAPAK